MRNRLNLVLLIAAALAAGYFGFFFFDVEQSLALVKYLAYWLLLAACVALAWQGLPALAGRLRDHFPGRSLARWAPLVFILFVSVILWQSQPRSYKILMDEPVLAATALNLSIANEAMVTTRGFHLDGTFHSLGGYVDKRPILFSFLVSCVHNWFGYSPSNVFLLNALLVPVFLALLFRAGHLLSAPWGGYLAVCLMATVPLFAMMASSGMFDFINMLLLLAAGLAGHAYVKNPSDCRMNRLVLIAVLLAQTRYESVLYVLSAGLLIFYVWFREREIRVTKTLVAAPFLMLVFPWQQKVVGAYESFWQLDEGVEQPFALIHLWGNIESALRHFFASDEIQPNSSLLTVLFVGALIGLLGKILFGRRFRIRGGNQLQRNDGLVVVAAFGLVTLFNFFLLMAYHWGQVDDIMVTRIALPLILMQVLTVTYAAAQIWPKKQKLGYLIAAVCIYFALVTRPVLAQDAFLRPVLADEEAAFIKEKVAEYADQQALFISSRHLVSIVDRESSLPLVLSDTIKKRLELHRRLGSFSAIYIFYMVSGADADSISPEESLVEGAFELRVLDEQKLGSADSIHFAEVTAIRGIEDALVEAPGDIADFSLSLP